MRILRGGNLRDESLLFPVEVDEYESGQHQNADNSVSTEGGSRSKIVDEHSSNHSSATSAQTMMQTL